MSDAMNAPPSPPVVAVRTCGPLSGSAERCLMHLKRLQSELKESESAAQYRVLVQHDDAHAIIVLHVDSSSCTPVVGGGVAVDSLHCTVQYMLLSLLYRSTLHDARAVVSHFSLVAVGLHPRLLVDCSKVTQNNVTKALTCLAAYMLEIPALVDAPQPQPPRAISDLDSIMATCVSLAQSRPYKPGVILVSECNISSSASQPMSACAIALAVADCSFSVIKPVFPARIFPLGCIPDAELMSFIARRSGGAMWLADLALLGAVLITPDLFGSLDTLASRSHSVPEIRIILDAVSQRSSSFPQGRAPESHQPRASPLSLETLSPSLGGAGGVRANQMQQPRLLHKDAQTSNMQLWIASKARLGFVSRVLRSAKVGGSSVIIGAQMALAVAPGVEIVTSAVVASETDINSLIIQIHCDGLRFSDAAKQQPQPHQQQTQHSSPHQHQPQAGVRSAGLNGPLHNEVLQLAELLVFLDRQLARFVRVPYEQNPTISDSTHDTIMFLMSIPSPHLSPSMPLHHEFVVLSLHGAARIRDGGALSQRKDDFEPHRTKSSDLTSRRGSTIALPESTVDFFPAIEAALAAWSSVSKSGGAGVALAWKYAISASGSADALSDSSGCVDGVTVLVCIRARIFAGVAVFDAFGFNCPYSVIKSECETVVSALLRTAGLCSTPRRLNVPLPLWVSPATFSNVMQFPLSPPVPYVPKSVSDKSLVAIPSPSVAGKRLSTFSSSLHPCQFVQSLLLHTRSHTVTALSCTAASLAVILAQVRVSCGFVPLVIHCNSELSVSRDAAPSNRSQIAAPAPSASLSNIFVTAVLPPSLRKANASVQTCSLALASSCFLVGDHSVELRTSISLWNASVRDSVSLCAADIEWLTEVDSALKGLDERTAQAFALKTAIQTVLSTSSPTASREVSCHFLEQTSGSCLLQLSRPSNSDRLVFTTPHSSISVVGLVDALSTELNARFPTCSSKRTFASKIDDNHIGVILLSHTDELVVIDSLVLPEQDPSEPIDSYIGDVPLNLTALLFPDESEKSSIVPEVMSPAFKDWLRNVMSLCERTLSNAAFRLAHQIACLGPESIDSIGMLKVLGLAQCISIDITFADLLSVNEKTAASLFGSVSLFQSLSPEHIQRVEHAIADAISDHRATDAMLSFCSATSASGVYAMNIKQHQPTLYTRRASTLTSSSAAPLVDTSSIEDLQSALSPSLNSTSISTFADANESFASSVPGTGLDAPAHQHSTPLENDLMFVRIGKLTADGLVLDYLCEHSSSSTITKSNRLDTARKQDVSILQSLNARLSVRAISVYHLVAGTVSSCVLSILQSRRPLPDMLCQAVNTLMSSARYAPPAMRPSESSFTGHLVADDATDDVANSSNATDAQLVIDNLTLNRVSFHFAFVLFAPCQSGVTWLCLVQLPGDASVTITPATTLQDVSQFVTIPFWIVLRVSHVEASSVCVDSWILTDRDDRDELAYSVKLHVEFALLHANQRLLMRRLLLTRKLPVLLAQSRNSFSSAPLPEATRFPWGKPVSQWPHGSCGCRIIHHVILEVHYRLDIGEALAQILSQSFLRPWKIENASDVFIIGTEPESCVYAHVSKLEPRESSLQRSSSPTLSTNNSIIIRFHGVSESSCVDLQPFCSAISQKLQALCIQNLLGIIQRNPSLRLSREDVDLLADPASPPTKAASFYTPVHGSTLHAMRNRLAALVSRVFFRLRFIDRRPATNSSSGSAPGTATLRVSDTEDSFDFEDGAVFRFVRVGGEGGRNSDAWRGKAMSRGVGGDALSLALCRFSCTFCQDSPSTHEGGDQLTFIGPEANENALHFLDTDTFCQHKGGLLLECKMWIIGSMPSTLIISKISSLVYLAALESSCLCSVAALTAPSDPPMSLMIKADHIQRVHSASMHASSQLSSFKTIQFQWKLPLPSFALVSAFTMISGFIALQYNVSNKILIERDGDSDNIFALDTREAQLLRFGDGDEIVAEASQIASAASGALRRRMIALFSKPCGSGSFDAAQYCTLELTAVSLVASFYAIDGVVNHGFGDIATHIDRILEWTFLRNTLLSTVLCQKAALPICEPIKEFFTISITPLGVDGIEKGAPNDARSDIILSSGSIDNDDSSDLFPLPLDEMQLLRLVDGSDIGATYTFAPSVIRAVLKDGVQRQRWLSNAIVRRLLSLLQRVRRTIPKIESSDDPIVRHGQQFSTLAISDPPSTL